MQGRGSDFKGLAKRVVEDYFDSGELVKLLPAVLVETL
jgi:hypothetical protein